MISQVGVGKGLNIKGKSAKKNKLSGFVPFCQISKNEHKSKIEEAPFDSRIDIFYRSQAARNTVFPSLATHGIRTYLKAGLGLHITLGDG